MWARTLFWLVSPLLQSCLAFVMLRRGAYKTYRFFFAYTVFAIAAELTKFALYHPGRNTWVYFWTSWGSEAIYAILGFLAIYEVFNRVFENFRTFGWFKLLLPLTGGVMLVISILIPIVHPAVDTDPLLEGIF